LLLALLLPLLSTATGDVSLPGAAEQERFKAYFTQGERLYQQGEYGAAIWNFRQADAVRVTPEVAFDLAKCHEKLGDLAFSTFWYRQYLKRAPNANDALDVAERVGTVLARAEGEGRGLLELQSPGAVDLMVNKARFAEAPVAMFLAPGEYDVTATFPSGPKSMVTQIRTGKTTPVSFEPVPPPLLDATSGEDQSPLVINRARPGRPLNRFRIGAIASAIAGVVGIGVGVPFGVLSTSAAGRCCSSMPDPTLKTLAERQQVANQANTYAQVGNTAVAVGVGLVVVGAVLFVLTLFGLGS
jgi:hypothetical protein